MNLAQVLSPCWKVYSGLERDRTEAAKLSIWAFDINDKVQCFPQAPPTAPPHCDRQRTELIKASHSHPSVTARFYTSFPCLI